MQDQITVLKYCQKELWHICWIFTDITELQTKNLVLEFQHVVTIKHGNQQQI